MLDALLVYHTTNNTLQRSISIYNMHVVSRKAGSEVQAVARGENTEAELRESTGKLICVKAPLKKGGQCAIVDFKKEHVVVIFCIHFDDINIKRLWAETLMNVCSQGKDSLLLTSLTKPCINFLCSLLSLTD